MRAIIVANGPTPEYPRGLQRQEEDWIIAANGGSLTALRWGWLPHDVVGDLDSLPPDLRNRLQASGSRFAVFPQRKDWTDLELALQHAVDGGATEIIVLGTRGGRLDQELANLLLLGRAEWADVRIRVLDGTDSACVVRRECTISGQVGDTVSLIPLSPQVDGVSTRGLEWPLANGRLEFGSTLGISNELSEPQAAVQVSEGVLLVVHSRRQADGAPEGDPGSIVIHEDCGAGYRQEVAATRARKEE
jgi:thiamine pyrophosphokinase